MFIIPTESTPHFKVNFTVMTPTVHDKRGISNRKTTALAETVCDDTYKHVLKHLYGEHFHQLQLPITKELIRIESGYKIELYFAAPVDFEPGKLTQELERIWLDSHKVSIKLYVTSNRYYTFEENIRYTDFA